MSAVTGMCLEVCLHALIAVAHRRNRPLTPLVCVGLIFRPPILQNESCSAGSCSRHSLIVTSPHCSSLILADPALSVSTEPLLRCLLASVRQKLLNVKLLSACPCLPHFGLKFI